MQDVEVAGSEEIEAWLNARGQDGWELVHFRRFGRFEEMPPVIAVVMKRQVAPARRRAGLIV